MNRTLVRFAVGTGAVLGAVLLATPAFAVAGPNYHGSDYSETLRIQDDIIEVCDQEADGHGVSAHYYLNDGSYHERGDSNGSASPCSFDDWTASPWWVTQFKTFEASVSSSQAWTFTDGPGGH
jgi:hypothetical protein